MIKFPHCVSDGLCPFNILMIDDIKFLLVLDIRKQNHELASTVHQIRGHIKGRTLLPFPQQGANAIEDEEIRVRQSDGKKVNMMLKNNIEGIILKWAHQVRRLCVVIGRLYHNIASHS